MTALLLALSFVGVIKSIMFVGFILCALLLILVVLLQEPKGGGLSGAFGGAGAETFGVQTGNVNKFTSRLAFVFLALAIGYAAIREGDPTAASDRIGDGEPTIGATTDPDEGSSDETDSSGEKGASDDAGSSDDAGTSDDATGGTSDESAPDDGKSSDTESPGEGG
jgi:preprotein translocase subunit SecG